jgi:hypothetical protein
MKFYCSTSRPQRALLFILFFQGNRWRTPGSTLPTLRASWSLTGVGSLSPVLILSSVASLTESWDQLTRSILASLLDIRCAIFFKSFLCVSLNSLNLGECQILSRWREGRRWKGRSIDVTVIIYRTARGQTSGAIAKPCIYRRELTRLIPSNLAV